jgi:hypothetical protein
MIVIILCVVGILLQLFTIILHGIGLYILRCLDIDGRSDVQQTYIFNLSAMEVFTTFCFLVLTGLHLTMSLTDHHLEDVKIHNGIILFTFCSLVLYMNMLYIVIDKALEVFWNIKYPVYWSMNKAKYLEMITWSIGLFMCIGVIIAVHVVKYEYRIPFTMYFRPALDIVFVITVIVCYGYIFYKYKQSRVIPTQARCEAAIDTSPPNQQSVFTISRTPRAISTNQQSLFTIFRNSRFFISICLVSTFLLFIVIPDILQFLITVEHEENQTKIIRVTTTIIYTISFASDACIYVFLNVQVKRLLYRKLRVIGCLRNNIPNSIPEEIRQTSYPRSIQVETVVNAGNVITTTF